MFCSRKGKGHSRIWLLVVPVYVDVLHDEHIIIAAGEGEGIDSVRGESSGYAPVTLKEKNPCSSCQDSSRPQAMKIIKSQGLGPNLG